MDVFGAKEVQDVGTSSPLSAGLYELVNEEEEVENWGLRW